MKKLLKCRAMLFVLISWAVLSVIGYLGKDNIYKKYERDVKSTPYFVAVLQGFHDGVYPWSEEKPDFWVEWLAQQENGTGGPAGTEESLGTTEIAETDASETVGTESLETEMSSEMTGTETATENTEPATEMELQPKEFIQVERSYFDDAVFIGDSRTVGLHDYGGLDSATFYATVGLNVYDMWEQKFCEVDGVKVTLEEALSKRQFKKIYFQIGINEMGRGNIDTFMTAYQQSVLKFQELQPDAVIYVQGIMRVAKAKSDSDAIFNNPGINARNERIAQLADNQKIFYIDLNEVICDEEGNLRADLTFDNLHLYGSKYNIWVDFLLTKGLAI